jgi:polar amino acid transport system substrate-binding protein
LFAISMEKGGNLRNEWSGKTIRMWLLSWAILSFSLAHSSQVAAAPTLVLNDPTNPPYTTSARDGILDVLVGEAVRRCGYSLQLVRLPAERGLINANDGIEDGDLSRIAGLEKSYPNLIRVPEKIFDMEFVALTRQHSLRTARWSDLEAVSVGHITGWKIFEQNLTPKTAVVTATTPEQLLDLLRLGRVDAALYSRWMGLALARSTGMGDVRVAEPPLATREMYIYLHKRHADLAPRLAEALRQLKREGTYQKIYDQKLLPYRGAAAP